MQTCPQAPLALPSSPISSPIPGATAIFVVPHDCSRHTAPNVTTPIDVIAEGGIPLLNVAMAPGKPLEIGAQVYARMVGPEEFSEPMGWGRKSRELGIEGRIVAARRYRHCVDFIVENESWCLASYVSVLVWAVPRITVTLKLLRALDALDRAGIPEEDRQGASTYTPLRCTPGTGARDADYMYITLKDAPPEKPRWTSRHPATESPRIPYDRLARDLNATLGKGWITEMCREVDNEESEGSPGTN